MKITKNRFFENSVTGVSFMEKIEWILAGTEVTSVDDPRAVSIGEDETHPVTGLPGFDLWIPLSVSNCGSMMSSVDHLYKTELTTQLDPKGMANMVNKRTEVIAYTRMNIYSQPLKPNTLEISMSKYNANMASVIYP